MSRKRHPLSPSLFPASRFTRVLVGFQFEAVHFAGRPDARLPSANEAIVASRVWNKHIRQVPPELRTRWSLTRGTPRGLFGRSGLPAFHFIVGEFVAHDSRPRFGSLKHALLDTINRQTPIARPLMH